jgi:hypothetical protein
MSEKLFEYSFSHNLRFDQIPVSTELASATSSQRGSFFWGCGSMDEGYNCRIYAANKFLRLIIMLNRWPVSTLDVDSVGRKVRKTAIRLPNLIKINGHLKIALLYINFIGVRS